MKLSNFENQDSSDIVPSLYIENDNMGFLEESIDDFLRKPIDSRNETEEPQFFEKLPHSNEQHQKIKPVLITVKPTNMNTVLFDWNSTIKRLSNKLKPEKARPKSRGLPNIARREIQQEQEEIRRRNTIERVPTSHETKIVYPLRKNELPLLRKVPTVLTETKKRKRYR